jgi:hypothetical protein
MAVDAPPPVDQEVEPDPGQPRRSRLRRRDGNSESRM